jgi:hypothetical protein
VRRIKAWLEQGAAGSLKLEGTFAEPVGLVLEKGCNMLKDGHTVAVILKKDATSVLGYRIHTAYIDP